MGLSLRSLGKRITDITGGVERQINPFDAGLSYKTKVAAPEQRQQSVLQQAGRLAGGVGHSVVNPIIQFPLNVGSQVANLPVFGAGKVTPSQISPVSGLAKFSGATGTPQQTLSSGVQTALSFAAPGLSRGIEAGVGRLLPKTAPAVVQRVAPRIVSNSQIAGGFNAAAAAGEPNVTPGNIVKAYGQGAALGTALPIAGAAIRPAVKLTGKAIDNRVPLNVSGGIPLPKVRVKQSTAATRREVLPAKNGLAQEIKQGLSDKDQVILDELRSVEKQTGQKGLVDKFMYNSNMQRGSNAGANQALTQSPNIRTAIGGLSKNDYKNFSDYANARTELSTADRGSTSVSLPELQARVQSASPEFQARFEALNAHYKELADKALESGLISRQTHANYVKNNNYVRIQRDMGDLLPPQANGRGNSYSLGQTVMSQKRKGSSREILPAGETAADYTQRIYREAAKNRTGTQLIGTLQSAGLAKKLRNAADATHKNSVSIIRNGKTEYFEVSPQIKEAVQNINPYHMNAVMQILAAPGRVLRAGVTGLNPVFIARNLIKDQVGTAINSTALKSTHNPASFFSGLFHASRDAIGNSHDDLYNDFLKHYGDQTSYDLTRNVKDTQQVINRIRGGKVVGVLQGVKAPIRSLENIASITEKSTRFQNYRGAYKKAISDGLAPEQASERAAIAAWQNSVDFSRAGTWGRVINTVIPYWNPGTQGVRQMSRTLTRHPVKSSFTGAALVGLPLATATAWNLSSPDTAQVYANIPEYEKDNNLILIPPGTKQNKDGSYDVIKIPLPPGYKDAFMPIRRTLEAFHRDKPVDGVAIAHDILQTVSGPVNTQSVSGFVGSFVPQGAKPLVQQYANKDLFTNKAIIPDYVNQAKDAQGNPIPENKKAYKYSSGTARTVGNALGISPIRIEKFIKDTSGTVGLNVLNAVDSARAEAGQIPKEQVGGQSIGVGFKRSFGSAQGIDNTNKTAGAKYFENVKKVTSSLNGNELSAFNSLHPAKKNFLGDTISEMDSVYNPAARLDVYNRYPKVFEADQKLDAQSRKQGNPGNPLFNQETWQVKKILEKDNLPPGADDPELSKLYTQPWYQDYQSKKSAYFTSLSGKAKKDGKSFSKSDNPYPATSASLQKVMDYYSSLPKGTGARKAWIQGNPGEWNAMQEQYAKIDNWQNIQRGKRGLDTTEGVAGIASGYGTSSGYGSSGGSSNPTLNAHKYAVSLHAGGSVAKPKKPSTKQISLKSGKKFAVSKPKVSIKRSKV